MLVCYGAQRASAIPLSEGAKDVPESVHWIDALEPTAEEIMFLEQRLRVSLPTRDDLLEVEASSRTSVIDGAVTLSMPATIRDPDDFPRFTPIGFVVTESVVVTLRFARLLSFEVLAERIARDKDLLPGGAGATVSILEIVVDHFADVLEKCAGNLDDVSLRAFERARCYGRGAATRRSNEPSGARRISSRRSAKASSC